MGFQTQFGFESSLQGTIGTFDIRRAYAEHLQEFHWTWFYTQTYGIPRTDVLRTQQTTWKSLAQLGVGRAFLAVEPHATGELHIHGLLEGAHYGKFESPEVTDLSWEHARTKLLKRFGRVRLERVNNSTHVSNYCAKYVLKGSSRGDHYGYFGDVSEWKHPEALASAHPQYTVKLGSTTQKNSGNSLTDIARQFLYDVSVVTGQREQQTYDRKQSGIIGSQRVWLKP